MHAEERAEHVVGGDGGVGDGGGGVSGDNDDGVSGDDDDGVSDDVVSSDESGVSSDGEEVVDLAGCSRAVDEKRVGEHGVRFGVDWFGEGWTPVGRRQKRKRDLEIGGGLRVLEEARWSCKGGWGYRCRRGGCGGGILSPLTLGIGLSSFCFFCCCFCFCFLGFF